MRVPPNDHIGRHIYFTGEFDHTVVRVLYSIAKSNATILDIGANIGYVSCSLLQLLPMCDIVSVEPQPDVFSLLRENVAPFGSKRVVAVNAAISDHAGEGSMVFSKGNSGTAKLVRDRATANAVAVDVITVAELISRSNMKHCDLIKVDVEGHEAVVLEALAPLIERDRPSGVVFEHGADLRDKVSPIRRLFISMGYDLFGIHKTLTHWHLIPVDCLPLGSRLPNDYLATPR